MVNFERLMMLMVVFVVVLVIWRWKVEGFWCRKLRSS